MHLSDEYVQSVENHTDVEDTAQKPYSTIENPPYVPPWIAPYVNHARAIKNLTPTEEKDSDSSTDTIGDDSGA